MQLRQILSIFACLLAISETTPGDDALRRVQTETSAGATHVYRYGLSGERLGVQYGMYGGGNGKLVTSSYDALGRLATLSESGRTTAYGYDLKGNVVKKTLPDGEVVSTVYGGQR